MADERLRIARDLHDVVGHELAIVNVGVAEVALPTDPDDALTALRSAREGLQLTLQETQRIIDLLRAGDGVHAADHRGKLAQAYHISPLIECLRIAGIEVHTRIDSVHLTSTPMRRRYGSGPARIRVSAEGLGLITEVRNRIAENADSSTDCSGCGTLGMRVHAARVEIEISQTGSEFIVHAELPQRAGGEWSASSSSMTQQTILARLRTIISSRGDVEVVADVGDGFAASIC